MADISAELITRAAKLSTATVHEAAGRLGALPHDIRPLDRAMHVAGRALPVRCPAGDNLFIHRALAEAADGDVLVVDTGADGRGFGYWGEIMATAAMVRGVSGLVITGGVRDSLQLIQMGHPTFSATVTIRGTGKNSALDGAVGEPIRLGEVVVRRGDLVIGDADGVVVIASAIAAEIVQKSEDRDRAESDIIERINQGALTLDVYNL